MSDISAFLGRLLLAVRRAVMAVAGLVLVGCLLLLGLVLGFALLLWALLRGRRPAPVNLRWARGGMPSWATRGARQGRSAASEVVDIQAREVPAANDSRLSAPRPPGA